MLVQLKDNFCTLRRLFYRHFLFLFFNSKLPPKIVFLQIFKCLGAPEEIIQIWKNFEYMLVQLKDNFCTLRRLFYPNFDFSIHPIIQCRTNYPESVWPSHFTSQLSISSVAPETIMHSMEWCYRVARDGIPKDGAAEIIGVGERWGRIVLICV